MGLSMPASKAIDAGIALKLRLFFASALSHKALKTNQYLPIDELAKVR
jgi:hypothetical protein